VDDCKPLPAPATKRHTQSSISPPEAALPSMPTAVIKGPTTRGFHSSTFQLNLSRF
jgi:hypothetical protein